MNAIEAIHGRRSVRTYRPEAVDRSVIEDLAWAAAQAPTPPASGDAPWAFCVVEGRDRLAAYGERAKAYALEHQPADRPWTWPTRPGFKVFWGAPAALVICARRDNPETPFDCCRAGQNFMLAAHTRGLGSCWVGAPLPWLRNAGVAAELGLPPDFEAEVVIVFGHADERPIGNPRARPALRWL